MANYLVTLERWDSGLFGGSWSKVAFWMPVGKNGKKRKPVLVKPTRWQQFVTFICSWGR